MASKRQQKTMTPEEQTADYARIIAEIESIQSQGQILSQEFSKLAQGIPGTSTVSRSPGRFKGRIQVTDAFFEPLSNDDLHELAGG